MNKVNLLDYLDSLKEEIQEANQYIWENPEISGNEELSANMYRKKLSDNGFKIVEVEGMDHAFYAEYGSGYPTIAVLGEYDALPDLSQKVGTEYNPVKENGPGHGCGHNLLGSAPYGASLAIKKFLDESGLEGTIRYYGCPEEETLSGKVKMIKAGAFEGCDVALSWHPMAINTPLEEGFLSMNSLKYKFKGISAHAAASPESGRSALDAVELMNIGANYLREHVIDKARIHYTITNAGGAPNIIPKDAESWYYVRAPHRSDVEDITERLNNIAKGASIMTDTEFDVEVISGCYEMLPNKVLFDLTSKNMNEVKLPEYTEEEVNYAKKLQETLDSKSLRIEKNKYLSKENDQGAIFEGVLRDKDSKKVSVAGSSDSGDVSWIMPMNLFLTSTFPLGVVNHSWQATSASGSSLGTKGMMYAARVFTGILYDLLTDTNHVKNAVDEFNTKTQNNPYTSPLDQ